MILIVHYHLPGLQSTHSMDITLNVLMSSDLTYFVGCFLKMIFKRRAVFQTHVNGEKLQVSLPSCPVLLICDYLLYFAGGVGFDINCGVRLLRTNLDESDVQPVKEQLAQAMFDHIPVGVGSKGVIPMSAK